MTDLPRTLSYKSLLGPMVLGVCLLIVLSVRYWKFTVDDAYIPLRYARNLLRGNGLVYNVGERVEGFTSFTWTLLDAAILWVGLDPFPALKIVGLLCAILVVWTSLLIVRRLGPQDRGLELMVAFMIGAAPCIVAWAVAGMETMLFALLLNITFYLYICNSKTAGCPLWAIVAFVATLTRPEGILIVPILVLFGIWARPDSRYDLFRATEVFAVLIGLFLIARYSYYGDLVPNTYHAKISGQGWDAVVGGGRYLIEFGRSYCGALAVVLLAVLCISSRTSNLIRLLGVVCVVYFIIPIVVGSDWMPLFRYIAPYWPMMAILLTLATANLADLVGNACPQLPVLYVRSIIVGSVIAGFALLYAYQIILAYNPGGKRYGHYGISIGYHADAVTRYVEAGRRLADIARPGDSLAAYAIGAIGYYSDIYIIDAWGLVDSNIATMEWPQRLEHIIEFKPTFVEAVSGEATTTGLTMMPEFRANYEPLGVGPIDSRIYVLRGASSR